jgi:hypothetical protein
VSRASFSGIKAKARSGQTWYVDVKMGRIITLTLIVIATGVRITGIVKENIPEEIKSFKEDVWSEDLLMDSKLEFYKALGGGKANTYSKAGFLATLANPFSQLFKNIRKGRGYKQKTNLVGEGLTTGGMYVVYSGSGTPAYSFLEKVIGDHADMKAVLDACEKVAKAKSSTESDTKKSGL